MEQTNFNYIDKNGNIIKVQGSHNEPSENALKDFAKKIKEIIIKYS